MRFPVPLRRVAIVATLILLVSLGLIWQLRVSSHSEADRSTPSAGEFAENSNVADDIAGKKSAGDSTKDQETQPPAASVASSTLPDNTPPTSSAPMNVPAGNGPPEISTRAIAAKGRTVAQILQDADMTDPDTRARVVAEMRLLEESQKLAVETKANELGIPLRIEGPGHKLSTLYDIRDGKPLYRTTLNANAAISSGANLLSPSPYSLNGSGIRVGVWDGGSVRSSHQELTGRATKKNASAAEDDHATHVAGTIGASGVQPAAKGMAPQINIDSYDWNSDYAEMAAAATTSAGDATGLPLSNHSYGYNAVTADMGRYEAEAAAVDAVAASLPYYLPFWAAGNEQDTLTAKGGYQSITFNGLAKNLMTIGAVDDAVTSGVRDPAKGLIAYFSSLGPCDDGRIKPDIVANGINLYSSVATSNTSYDGTYSGTSMATPNALGSASLLVQLYAREFSGQRMRASTLKALLIHTADDIGTTGPDYKYGWGLINVKKAADLVLAHKASLAAPKMIEGSITTAASTKTHTFTWDGVSPIRATVCWTDPAGTEQTGADSRTANLKNNLDAKITAPNGTTIYQPYVMPFVGTWTTASMASAATTGKNNVDNVEQVYLAAPSQAGNYTVTVSLSGALTGGSQVYSLIISGSTDVESNPPPTIVLTSPAVGSSFLSGVPVTVSATAADVALGGAPGTVSQVEFFNGTTSIGVDTTAPYSLNWSPPASGTYTITAKATDSEGVSATSTAAVITVLSGDGTPVISSFTPTGGPGGSLVVLTGSNFVNVTSVKFNGTDAVFTVDSSNQVTVTVPALATSGTISVVNSYGTGTSVGSFTVEVAPVLISQIYGAGGNSGATYKQDYVELYNRGTSTVSVAGWSVQYASSSGTTWQAVTLSGSIAPGKYYLVGLGGGSSGTTLPTPDASGSIAMSATTGKIALRNNATALTGSSPLGVSGVQDFVGFGTANAFEGAKAPAPSTTTAIFRTGGGATDTNNNADDFTAAAPYPRISASGPAITPVITSAPTAAGSAGTAFTYQITASNVPTSYNAAGLPGGLTVNTTTGAITGTPTAPGTFNATISASNTAGTGTAPLTLTINPGSGTNLLNENFVSITTGSSTNGADSGISWTGNTNFPTVSAAYQAGGAVRIGASGNIGSITSKTLNLSPNSGNFLVSFKVKGWTTVEGNIKVTVTGLTPQTVTYSSTMADSFETKTLSFSGGQANSTIKFETTAKRAFLDDILVYYTAATTTPVIGTSGSLTAVSTTYGVASPTTATFNVSGTDLTAGVLVTPPAGFEVSLTESSAYSSTVTIPASGTLASTAVFLRLAAGTTAGFYSGNVVCTSTGAVPVNVPTSTSEVRLKLLTITANNLSKTFGTSLVLGSGQTAFTSSGLVGSESIGSVTLTASGGTAPNDSTGGYSLTPSLATGGTFDPGNYDLDYVAGTLTVTSPMYSDWLANYSVGALTGLNDDADQDGLPNGIENILGTAPDASNTGLSLVSATGNKLVFRHTRSNTPADDLTASYEWSSDLRTWLPSAATEGNTTVTIVTSTITDNPTPDNDLVEVTATVTGTPTSRILVRLKATQP